MTTILREATQSPGEGEFRASMVRAWADLDRLDAATIQRVRDRIAALRADILDRLAAMPTVEIDGVETFQATSLRAFAAELEAAAARYAQRASLDLGNDLRAAAASSDQAHRDALAALARTLGVPPSLIVLSPLGIADAQIEAAIVFTTGAIKGVSQRIEAGVTAEIQAVVFGGRSRWDAVRNIRDLLATEPSRSGTALTGKALGELTSLAVAIERTALEMAFNIAADQAYRQALEELPDLSVEWVATRGPRTCPRCTALNGKRKDPMKAFPGGVIAPPLHGRCRCRIVAHLPSWGAAPVTPQAEVGKQAAS